MFQSSFQILAPGRVFLFGEHSDYLGLEVISMALDKTIKIDVRLRKDSEFRIKSKEKRKQIGDSLKSTKTIYQKNFI